MQAMGIYSANDKYRPMNGEASSINDQPPSSIN